MSLNVGARLGPYEIEAPLGAGGMGEVYKARDTRLHRSVAIKVVRVDKGDGPEDHRRLEREARAAAALKHRHICTIHDVGVHDGQPFIVMEYLEGGSLSQHLDRDGIGLSLDALLRYATQIADALAHAHARGVIHRDLKASNVVFDAGGEPKVLDFGLAKRVSDTERTATTATDGVTRTTGELIAGTIPYMAPEVLRGYPADERSDIWSLGVLVWRMASGRLPFTGATDSETIAAILRDPPLPLPSSLPRGLQAVVARCLAKERTQRYERASEVRAALETISADAHEGPGATEVREIRRLGPFTNPTPAAPDASGPLSSRQDERNRDSESLQKIASRLDVVAGVARLAIGGAVAMLVLGVLGFVTGMTFNLALRIPSIPSVADSLILGGRAMIPVAFWMLLDGAAVAVVLGAFRLVAPLVKSWSFGTGHRRPSEGLTARITRRVTTADATLRASTFGLAAVASVAVLAWFSWPLFSAIGQMVEQPPGTMTDTAILGTANETYHTVCSWGGATVALGVGAGWVAVFRPLQPSADNRGVIRLFKIVSAAAVACALLLQVAPWSLVWVNDSEPVTYNGRAAFLVSDQTDRLVLWVVQRPGGMALTVSADDPGVVRQQTVARQNIFDDAP